MYRYQDFKDKIETVRLVKTTITVTRLLCHQKTFTMKEYMYEVSGDSWENMAYIDHLVELGILVEVNPNPETWGQNRRFCFIGRLTKS